MMARRGVLALLSGGLAALLGGCTPSRRVRYKMNIEVDTPSGRASGSSVREILYEPGGSWFFLGESRASRSLTGEAVSVDLADGQTLFALLKGADGDPNYGARLPEVVFEAGQSKRSIELWEKGSQHGLLPLFVRFHNINDPATVEQVDPAHLEAAFGPGFNLVRVSVELTREPVTQDINQKLAWLESSPEPALNPSHGPKDYSISATTKHGDFHRGGKK